MKITFLPEQRMNEAEHALSGLRWFYGETKEIPDDQTIRVHVAGQSIYVNLVEDLLSNPAYKEAESKINPQFACSECEEQSLAEGYSDPLTGGSRLFEIDGKRLCPDCFILPTKSNEV